MLPHKQLPNLLTGVRLIGGAVVVPFLIYYLLPQQQDWLNFFLAGIFAAFSMTDFLDGYLARRYGLESPLGRALDPIADKFLVCASLIALLAIGKIYFWWVILLIGREMCMMSLRQLAALHDISVPVSYLGKIKACFQMFLIIVLIARPTASYGFVNWWSTSEVLLLSLTLYFALISLYRYSCHFSRQYHKLLN